jgi:thymidylate kinase
MKTEQGKLIVFEGPDGIGKTVLTQRLSDYLNNRTIRCALMSFPGREPGTLGHLVYGLHHNPSTYGVTKVDPTSLQVLHISAHIDAVESTIRPALKSGTWVILDRFWWSTLVYGRVLGGRMDSLEAAVDVERLHWNDIKPLVIFLISRSKPAREGEPLDRHLALVNEYAAVAAKYSMDSSVVSVSTDTSVDESFRSVLQELSLHG